MSACPTCGGELREAAAILCGRRTSGGRGCQPLRIRYCVNPVCRAVETEPGRFVGLDGRPVSAQRVLDLQSRESSCPPT